MQHPRIVIALGDKSPIMVSALRRALTLMELSDVAEMRTATVPKRSTTTSVNGFAELEMHARERADNALFAHEDAGIGIGVALGLTSLPTRSQTAETPFYTAYAAAVNREKNLEVFPHFACRVPGDVADQVRGGMDLRTIVQRRSAGDERDPVAWFSEGRVRSEVSIMWAMFGALLPLFNPDRYIERSRD